MNVLIFGAGMMGRAIAYDLSHFSNFKNIIIGEKDTQTRKSASRFLRSKTIEITPIDVGNVNMTKKHYDAADVVISAVPYRFNYTLAKIAVETGTHFIDLGGNNTIVQKERGLFKRAKKEDVTIIPDLGLAPGLASIITHDIVNHMETVDSVKLRVGGLPIHPRPPLKYQIVFSPYGLINEYVEDAIVLDHGKILQKKSMTDMEFLEFPRPFGTMEAFLTSGGCSTLPYTYTDIIQYLDYKTIRYPGHCEKINTFLELGLAEEKRIRIGSASIIPRDIFASLLLKHVPTTGEDVVLLKALGEGRKNGKKIHREYLMIDYYDKKHNITAMMRTTGYPVSITAQMIQNGTIQQRGVFCPEEIIPPAPFFKELKKRGINIIIRQRRG
jgi:lysine 6-dehydrogenase